LFHGFSLFLRFLKTFFEVQGISERTYIISFIFLHDMKSLVLESQQGEFFMSLFIFTSLFSLVFLLIFEF